METQFDQIMERIRVRQSEMSDDVKENEKETVPENNTRKEEGITSSPAKVFGSSSKLNTSTIRNNFEAPKTPLFKAAEPSHVSPQPSAAPVVEQTSARKARFSAMAQEYNDFECDYTTPYNKPKEAYMKGKSPRMSIGETRPSVLCTPAGAASLRSPNIAKTPPASGSKSAPSLSASNSQKCLNESTKNVNEIEVARQSGENRIKFAHPMVNINYLPNESSVMTSSSNNDTVSTVLGGSAEMMNVTTSSLSCDFSMNHHLTVENTILNSQTCDNRDAIIRERNATVENMSNEEYGAHTFMRKKVPKVEPIKEEVTTPTATKSSPSLHTIVSSPKPFSKERLHSKFSPVNFTPKSTSSPITQPDNVMSPSKSAALQSSVAKTMKQQFEQKLKTTNTHIIPVPHPRQTVNPVHSVMTETPHVPHHYPVQKQLFPTVQKATDATTPTLPGGVQTQWRGQHNTPVVQGAKAEDKTAGEHVVGAGRGNLKSLKSRWEFSSATGTPIHPDASEDSLIATAIKMKESAIPTRIGKFGRKAVSGTSVSSKNVNAVRSTTASPASKNTRYEEPETFDDVLEEDDIRPEENEEYDPVEQEEVVSEDEIASTDASRIIDQVFDYLGRDSKMGGTPSPYRQSLDGTGYAPIAKSEDTTSPHRRIYPRVPEPDVIEEEDVPMGESDEDEDDDRTECGDEPTIQEESTIRKEFSRRENERQLPHSVSFYRKMQKERVAGEGMGYLPDPSMPQSLPLTSTEAMIRLTGFGESSSPSASAPIRRIIESETAAKERIVKAIQVEDAHISQARTALAHCRETPTFRGSREEIELQRVLLTAIEKQRALRSEFERLRKEGPRIFDGPRGDVTISQFQVNLSRDFVQANIASSVKSAEVHNFVAVLKWGEQVDVSKLVTSDSSVNRKGVIDFPVPMQLKAVSSDFKAVVEIYGQRSLRESFSHEEKYKLKGSAVKSKAKNTLLGGSSNVSAYVSPNKSSLSCDSNFSLLGSFSFDINSPPKKVYNMQTVYPLEGAVLMKIKKRLVDPTDVSYKGFLSMFQKTAEGLASWRRYWTVLDNGELKFWKQPEHETVERCLVLLDLSTCIKPEGATIDTDTCPYPNSFNIDVWVPKDDYVRNDATLNANQDIEKLRVKLAADTQQDLLKWLSVINASSKQLCTWRNGAL